jgi:hypothetical protein
MKKSPLLLALLVLSAPLLLKQKLVAAETLESQDTSKRKQVTELIKEYFTCGPDCPKKYKDALVAQIARIRNISKKKALALIIVAFLITRKPVYQPILRPVKDKYQRWKQGEVKLPTLVTR